MFHTKIYVDNGAVSIDLTGELDATSADELNRIIAETAGRPIVRLVLLMHGLTYVSSAGLRCLVFAHQKLGPAVEIVLVGTRPEIANTIRMTGIDRSVVLQEPAGSS